MFAGGDDDDLGRAAADFCWEVFVGGGSCLDEYILEPSAVFLAAGTDLPLECIFLVATAAAAAVAVAGGGMFIFLASRPPSASEECNAGPETGGAR